jgi:glutaredoxin 3
MSGPDITMYVTDWCSYCRRARGLLTKKGWVWTEINVGGDEKLREEMITRSGRLTVPQIFVGERHIGGCDDLFALDSTGELDRLIQGA